MNTVTVDGECYEVVVSEVNTDEVQMLTSRRISFVSMDERELCQLREISKAVLLEVAGSRPASRPANQAMADDVSTPTLTWQDDSPVAVVECRGRCWISEDGYRFDGTPFDVLPAVLKAFGDRVNERVAMIETYFKRHIATRRADQAQLAKENQEAKEAQQAKEARLARFQEEIQGLDKADG